MISRSKQSEESWTVASSSAPELLARECAEQQVGALELATLGRRLSLMKFPEKPLLDSSAKLSVVRATDDCSSMTTRTEQSGRVCGS